MAGDHLSSTCHWRDALYLVRPQRGPRRPPPQFKFGVIYGFTDSKSLSRNSVLAWYVIASMMSRSDSLFRSLLNSTVRVSRGGKGEFIGWLAPVLAKELRGLCQ